MRRHAEQVKVPPPEAMALFFALEGAPSLASLVHRRINCPVTFRFPFLYFLAI